ncbi:MAG TPA: flagellar motor protein [Lachnospiraceae bacterium]|nr:flagellar motor protein [Lachnospiraceae bacterium]
MARKRASGDGDCGSWMDTYGDMVTLLLCFFVMLYSMSTLDQQKWEVFVKSIFPNSGDTPQIAINEQLSEGEYDVSGNLEMDEQIQDPENMDNLYVALMEALTAAGVEGVNVSRQEDYTFLVFENQAFFGGDSSVLTDDAIMILDILCDVIAPYNERIAQIDIMGHTAQASEINDIQTDRVLSAMRSAEVAAYIEKKDVIDPSKLVGLSYGMYRSVDDSDTEEGRAKNRRVEFLIIDSGTDIKSMNDYYNDYYDSLNAGSVQVTGTVTEEDPFSPVNGSMEEAASTVPEEEINPPDAAEEPVEAPAE